MEFTDNEILTLLWHMVQANSNLLEDVEDGALIFEAEYCYGKGILTHAGVYSDTLKRNFALQKKLISLLPKGKGKQCHSDCLEATEKEYKTLMRRKKPRGFWNEN